MNREISYERYQRQISLEEFGMEGQQKLFQSKVLVIGAGGLGCPVLQYLAAAGTGTLGIVDDDIVSLINLHRQVLYGVQDIGLPKAIIAKEKLLQLNPGINITAYNERISVANAIEWIGQYDLVIDGTDNFATRYLINDACALLKKPLVYGAISKFEGQVAIFNGCPEGIEQGINYRDIFPNPPKEGEVLNCAQTGVLGVLPGIIGTMMANEAIKLITGIGDPLINRMLTYHALTNQCYEIVLSKGANSYATMPGSVENFQQMNYDWLCASDAVSPFELDVDTFNDWINQEDVEIIDLREWNEGPLLHAFNCRRIPFSELKDNFEPGNAGTIITFCQSGKRSEPASAWLTEKLGPAKKIYSLRGGIVLWQNKYEKQRS